MDCKTARLMLDFARPGAPELEAADAGALDAHLGTCADCDALARAERRLDAHLGRAVRQVEVPADLKARLLDRLAADRHALHRRWAGHGVRALAAVAAVLLVALGVQQWRWLHRPVPDSAAVLENLKARHVSPPNREELEAALKRVHGLNARLPDLDYSPLVVCTADTLPGDDRVVPLLVFARNVKVYVLSDQQFNLESLPPVSSQSEEGYPDKVRLEKADGGRWAYLYVYQGDSPDWLRPGRAGGDGNGN
jgi:hypothetical protein